MITGLGSILGYLLLKLVEFLPKSSGHTDSDNIFFLSKNNLTKAAFRQAIWIETSLPGGAIRNQSIFALKQPSGAISKVRKFFISAISRGHEISNQDNYSKSRRSASRFQMKQPE